MQTTFYNIFFIVVSGINLLGIAIILWGVIVSVVDFLRSKAHRQTPDIFLKDTNKIRAILGTYILFGLEFMIAADIIHTFIKPSIDDLIILGAIVAIRTVISYFLGREIEEARRAQHLKNVPPQYNATP